MYNKHRKPDTHGNGKFEYTYLQLYNYVEKYNIWSLYIKNNAKL